MIDDLTRARTVLRVGGVITLLALLGAAGVYCLALYYTYPRAQYPSDPVKFTEKPLILHWGEGMQMLKDAGHEVSAVRKRMFYG